MQNGKSGRGDGPRMPFRDNFRPDASPLDQKNYTPRPSEQGNVRPTTGESHNATPKAPDRPSKP